MERNRNIKNSRDPCAKGLLFSLVFISAAVGSVLLLTFLLRMVSGGTAKSSKTQECSRKLYSACLIGKIVLLSCCLWLLPIISDYIVLVGSFACWLTNL